MYCAHGNILVWYGMVCSWCVVCTCGVQCGACGARHAATQRGSTKPATLNWTHSRNLQTNPNNLPTRAVRSAGGLRRCRTCPMPTYNLHAHATYLIVTLFSDYRRLWSTRKYNVTLWLDDAEITKWTSYNRYTRGSISCMFGIYLIAWCMGVINTKWRLQRCLN